MWQRREGEGAAAAGCPVANGGRQGIVGEDAKGGDLAHVGHPVVQQLVEGVDLAVQRLRAAAGGGA
jgi:hypothetical protein